MIFWRSRQFNHFLLNFLPTVDNWANKNRLTQLNHLQRNLLAMYFSTLSFEFTIINILHNIELSLSFTATSTIRVAIKKWRSVIRASFYKLLGQSFKHFTVFVYSFINSFCWDRIFIINFQILGFLLTKYLADELSNLWLGF